MIKLTQHLIIKTTTFPIIPTNTPINLSLRRLNISKLKKIDSFVAEWSTQRIRNKILILGMDYFYRRIFFFEN